MKPQHLAFLIAGIVATILFIVFGEWIYELNYVNGFSDQMHNLGLNMPTAVITALIPWGVAAIYYYVINSVLFDRWYHCVLCYGEVGDDVNALRDKAKRLAKTVLGTDPYTKFEH